MQKTHTSGEELNITVAVRCRGRNEREVQAKSSVVVSVPDIMGSNEVSINTSDEVGIAAHMNSKTYTVDKVFGPSASQDLMFKEIAEPLFEDFIKGYNCTILVYGMTSTGKTYTMTGDEKLYDGELSDSAGIIPRVLFKLFESPEILNDDYIIKCSFVELYNEDLKDLLDDSVDNTYKKLRIFDSMSSYSNSTATSNNNTSNNTRNNSRNNSRSNSRNTSRNNSPRPSSSTNLSTIALKRRTATRPSSLSSLNPTANSSIYSNNTNNKIRFKDQPANQLRLQSKLQAQQNIELQQIHSQNIQQQQSQSITSNLQSQENKEQLTNSEKAPDNNNQIYIQNLQEFYINNATDGIKLLQKGLRHRKVASTKMNDVSSRSHTIFTITLYKEHNGGLYRVSKMNLVDLAGSENINKSGAQHQRAKEAGSINQSLLTLGRVINSLADKSIHIPFRESKLTRLLQDSLGGNTKTVLISTISPAKINVDETSSTLEYASKAKNIKNKPHLGSFIMKDVLLKNITTELNKIKSDLMSTRLKDGVYMSQQHYKELNNDLESYKTEVQESKRANERLISQNGSLLKDKKASNELNELQRIQIEKKNEKIKELYEILDEHYKREDILVELIRQLKNVGTSMQSTIENYRERDLEIEESTKKILENEFKFLKNELSQILSNINGNIIDNLKSSIISNNSSIEAIDSSNFQKNIDIIENTTLKILKQVQEKSQHIYSSCIERILSDIPNILNKFKIEINSIDFQYNDQFNKITENLSDLSEEYNNFKEYLNNSFLQNNYELILKNHLESGQSQIESFSNNLLLNINKQINEFKLHNSKLYEEKLNNIKNDIVKKETESIKPYKEKWVKSIEIINSTDKINNTFHNDMNNRILQINNLILQSHNDINNSINDIKVNEIRENEAVNEILSSNTEYVNNINELKIKNMDYQEKLKCIGKSSENSINYLDSTKQVIESGLKTRQIAKHYKAFIDHQDNVDEDTFLSTKSHTLQFNSLMKQIESSVLFPTLNRKIITPSNNNKYPLMDLANHGKENKENDISPPFFSKYNIPNKSLSLSPTQLTKGIVNQNKRSLTIQDRDDYNHPFDTSKKRPRIE
ncbi:hypothetical protein TBLA_0A07230 [Henningerozyma blattae CBS 6284]|uniref:Kinesin motor domain-containing protein n=1 Tax=Henningerozyma blattae (strain ATCC 34711 / CBS 6284 / DSM 70876 / NBRC 10599 / NRRL Y-10934 / UCD 77-7) TaxID=1071380 RepID=I2GWL1_HENB6|nr:hypothetical protein TBLA_0A07230 [Tetrapisispora blattae CBS 6284]CCH58513.1 hypothetical protein TBLA_0A07230 [Tetrapisispora blattae CBS 6284]